jgi:hypothetical protein
MITTAAIFFVLAAITFGMLFTPFGAGIAGVEVAVLFATFLLSGFLLGCTVELRDAIRKTSKS